MTEEIHDSGPAIYVLLHGRYPVMRELFKATKYQLDDALTWLDQGKVYLAAEVLGSCFWTQVDPQDRRLAGSCLSHLVRYEGFPLDQVNKRGTYPNRYRLASA